MKITIYKPKHREDLARLFVDFHSQMVELDSSGKVKPFSKGEHALVFVDKMIKNTEEKDGFIYLALVDDKLVGFIQGVVVDHSDDRVRRLVLKPDRHGWIGELYVDARSRNKGIARQLFNKATENLRSKNCTSVRLNVFESNEAAKKFYSSIGMVVRKYEMDMKL